MLLRGSNPREKGSGGQFPVDIHFCNLAAVRTDCQDSRLLDMRSAEAKGIGWTPCFTQLRDGPLFLRAKVQGDWTISEWLTLPNQRVQAYQFVLR
jgi:hypothetical protein